MQRNLQVFLASTTRRWLILLFVSALVCRITLLGFILWLICRRCVIWLSIFDNWWIILSLSGRIIFSRFWLYIGGSSFCSLKILENPRRFRRRLICFHQLISNFYFWSISEEVTVLIHVHLDITPFPWSLVFFLILIETLGRIGNFGDILRWVISDLQREPISKTFRKIIMECQLAFDLFWLCPIGDINICNITLWMHFEIASWRFLILIILSNCVKLHAHVGRRIEIFTFGEVVRYSCWTDFHELSWIYGPMIKVLRQVHFSIIGMMRTFFMDSLRVLEQKWRYKC